MKNWLFYLCFFLLLCNCAKSPELATVPTAGDTAKTDVPELPEIDMAAELAKLDTMLAADSPSAAAAHENFLRALDMLEADRIIFAELFYKRALANDPASNFLLSELIKTLLKQNKIGEAFPLLKLAVQTPKATADNFLYMARLYKEYGNLDSAEIFYKKATDKMNDNYALYEYAQLLEFQLKALEFKKDEQELDRICRELKRIYDILLVELDYPPRLLEKQLIFYRITDESDSAIAGLLGEAFKTNGIEYALYGYQQAEILSSLKKYKEANEVLLTIFFMHPSKELTSAVALRIANNYELMDSITVAVIWLEQFLAQDPENHIAMNNLGYMLIDRDMDLERGMSLVEKALTYSPDERSYLDSKAWGLYKMGKYQEALDIFEKLEASGMDAKELWLHLAKVCEALNLHERAKGYMSRIRE